MFGKMVQRFVKPGASFFGDIGNGFDGAVVLLGNPLAPHCRYRVSTG
jgi:hypothetical protein